MNKVYGNKYPIKIYRNEDYYFDNLNEVETDAGDYPEGMSDLDFEHVGE